MHPNFSGISELLSSPKEIVITNHINPDGDAMGSALGLCKYLRSKGHNARVVVPNEYPTFLHWLPGNSEVVNGDTDPEKASSLLASAEVIFSLDYNDPSRSGGLESALVDSSATKIMIDHHREPVDFVDYMISDPSIGSTCQMIYHFVEAMGDLDLLDVDMGNCIYTGILTDSGSFRFSSTTATTHRVVAHLLDLGVKPDEVHQKIYDTSTLARYKMLGILLNTMEVFQDRGIAILRLSLEEMKRWNAQKGDTEGFVNYGLGLTGIKMAIFLKEDEEKIKMSFRSKGDIDVNEFARAHFNGGGHKNAAGGMSKLSLEETLDKVKSLLL